MSEDVARPRTGWYPWYVVVALLACYVVSFMDRTALSLLVDPIRQDLGLGDTGMGFLIGFGFVFLYATAGLFLGRVADLGDRRLLIMIGLVAWSLATAACGLATGFTSLLVARIFVGLGEAALSPASYSLIADYFPRRRLGLATGIFTLGVAIGGGLGSFLISQIAQMGQHGLGIAWLAPGTGGWRSTFVLLGALGIPMALLVATIREPRRTRPATRPALPTLGDALRYLRGHRRLYGGLMLGYSTMTISTLGVILWGPTYFLRVHGLTRPETGLVFGVALSVFGTIGLLAGGWLSDRLFARGVHDAPPRITIFALLAQTPFYLVMFLASDVRIAIAAFLAATTCSMAHGGLQMTSFQLVTPDRLRGLTIALYLMLTNLIGMGLGPLIIALITDHVFHDPTAIGKSMAIVVPGAAILAAAIVATTLGRYRALVASQQDAG